MEAETKDNSHLTDNLSLKDHYATIKCGFDANREGKLNRYRGADGPSRHPHQGPRIEVYDT